MARRIAVERAVALTVRVYQSFRQPRLSGSGGSQSRRFEGGRWLIEARGKQGTHIGKLRYYIFALIVSIEAMSRPKVIRSSYYGLFVVGILGAAIGRSDWMLAS